MPCGWKVLARGSRGFKKLDVGYSTVDLGLALGISIKTINFRDEGTNRFTKNYSRVDNELRAEAMDYHKRQPYAILTGVLFLPVESCNDAAEGKRDERGLSSFGAAVRYFRQRSGRVPPHGDPDLFEAFFIGLYDRDADDEPSNYFFDVNSVPPRSGEPPLDQRLTFGEVIRRIVSLYDDVNDPAFNWAD